MQSNYLFYAFENLNLKTNLKKYLSIIFISCFSLLSAEYQYELRDLGTLSLHNHWEFISLNNQGTILMSCKEDREDNDHWYCDSKFGIWDINNGFRFLPLKENQKIEKISKMNNLGFIIGIIEEEFEEPYKGNNEDYDLDDDDDNSEKFYNYHIRYPFIWNSSTEEFIILNMLNRDSFLIDLNDQNQVIGYDNNLDNYFIFENNEFKYLNFQKELSEMGFHQMDYSIEKINNKGEILGSFDYGVKHPYKNKWRKDGTQYFLWDGQVKLIEDLCQKEGSYHGRTHSYYLTDASEVYFKKDYYNPEIYKWDPVNGTHNTEKNSIQIFSNNCISQNMLNAVENNRRKPKIWKDGKIIVNYCEEEEYTCLFDYSQFPGVTFKSFKQINDQGQIVLEGEIWNESHYFLMDPIQK